MAKVLTTTNLINTSLRRAMIPSDQSTFTCCDIIDIMNEELGIHILPMVLRAHEEYYVVDEDVALVNGQSRYKIPYRAVGNKLRDVQYIDASGAYYEMTRVSLEHRPDFQKSGVCGSLINFYVENDNIVLLCSTCSTGRLRMSYYLRPNDLVKNDRAAKISAITAGACCCTVFTVSSFPTHLSCETSFDIVQGRSPNKIIAFDIGRASSDAVTKTMTFANSELTDINLNGSSTVQLSFSVGDYILSAEETIVAQLPAELQPILAQRTSIKMLEALGDMEGMKMAQNELERMEYNAQTLIDNRVEGAPQKAVNRHSQLRFNNRR